MTSLSGTDSRDERHMRGSRDGREKEYVPKKITTPLDMSKLATQVPFGIIGKCFNFLSGCFVLDFIES